MPAELWEPGSSAAGRRADGAWPTAGGAWRPDAYLYEAWETYDDKPAEIGGALRAAHVQLREQVQPDPDELADRVSTCRSTSVPADERAPDLTCPSAEVAYALGTVPSHQPAVSWRHRRSS